jgi:hypothetical protein
VSPL